jgi:GH24 family phage-related lysozyme (muramidase)
MGAPDRDKLKARLKYEEGFSPVSFWDRKQYTWGYGTPAPKGGLLIDRAQADAELDKQIDVAIATYHNLFGEYEVDTVRATALADMCYNLGQPTLSKFHCMIVAVKHGEWERAALEAKQSLWYIQTKDRAIAIVRELRTGVEA